MMKNKKTILLAVVFFIIFYIAITIILSLPRGKKYENTVFIGNFTKVSIDKGNIKIVNEDVEIAKQKVKVYFKDSFVDGYISSVGVDYDGIKNGYEVVDENGNNLAFETTFVAYTGNLSLKVKESNTLEGRDYTEVYKFAAANNISISEDIYKDYLYISTFDLDNDGNLEYVYSFGYTNGNNEYVSMVFLKKGETYTVITSETNEYNDMGSPRIRFNRLIDFNNDGEYEFVVEKMMSEYGPDYYELYSFDGNTFTKLGGE